MDTQKLRDDEAKYPEDPPGAECSPNARVWGVYNEEAKVMDAAMVGNLRENADVFLVFAGLFSAVLTTFVAQTSQSLQRDYSPITASLTFEMVQLQRAMLNGSNGASVPSSSWTPESSFSPETSDVWVNGLWFASLALSLVTSLIAVLAKQWLSHYAHYASLPSFSNMPLDKVRARQFRHMNFVAWQVPLIIGLLPFLLHIALFMFLAGLVVYLFALLHSLAYTVTAIAGTAFVAYSASVFVSVVKPSCPYHTTLSEVIFKYSRRFLSFGNDVADLRDLQQSMIASNQATLDSQALLWLLRTSSSLSVRSIAIQALGCVSTPVADLLLRQLQSEPPPDLWESQQALIKDILEVASAEDTPILQPVQGAEAKFRRLLQAQQRFASKNSIADLIVPRGWFEKSSEPMVISDMALIYMSDTTASKPEYWPSFPEIMPQVMRAGRLPLHAWKDLFKKADIAAMCRIGGTNDRNPDYEMFVAVYLSAHRKPTATDALNIHLPAVLPDTPRSEREGLFHFPDIIDDFDPQFEGALLSQLPDAPHMLSPHLRVVHGVLEHFCASWPSESVRSPGNSSHVLGPHCRACTELFMAALERVSLMTASGDLLRRGMPAFEAVIRAIVTASELFPNDSPTRNTAKSPVALWKIRSRVLLIYAEMACSKWINMFRPTNDGYCWDTTTESIRNIIAVSMAGNDISMLHDTNQTSVESYHRNRCLSRLHCLLLVHWQTISPVAERNWLDVQSTYDAFRRFDAFGLMALSIYHFPTWILAVYAYVDGLAHLDGLQIDKQPYLDYLQGNLYTVLLVVTGGFSRNRPSDKIVKRLLFDIVELCTDEQAWHSALTRLTDFAEFDDQTVVDYCFWDSNDDHSYEPADFRLIQERVREYSSFIAEHRSRARAAEALEVQAEDFVKFYEQGIHSCHVLAVAS